MAGKTHGAAGGGADVVECHTLEGLALLGCVLLLARTVSHTRARAAERLAEDDHRSRQEERSSSEWLTASNRSQLSELLPGTPIFFLMFIVRVEIISSLSRQLGERSWSPTTPQRQQRVLC